MSKTKNNANSGITFKQGLQLFFVRKILDDTYTMGTLVGSEWGNEFFRQWSQIVCDGRKKDKNFQCTVKVPEDFGREIQEEMNLEEKTRRRLDKTFTSFAPEEYQPLLTNSRFSSLLSLLGDEDLGQLMRIPYPAEAEAGEIAAVVGTSKDADMIREAIARELRKRPDELNDEDYKKITELDLSNSEISDLEPIKGLSSLQQLDLEGTQVSDLEPIKGLSSLQELSLVNTQVSNLEPIKGLSSLQKLVLSHTQVSNLEPIKRLSNLQRLWLFNTQVSNVEPIKGLSSLQEVSFGSTQVSDLEPIKGLSSLKVLYLGGTKVSNLEPIKGLSSLQELELSNMQVSNLEPIKGLSSLKVLFLEGTQNIDLEPIKGLSSLQFLDLRGTQVSDEQVEELQKALPKLAINR